MSMPRCADGGDEALMASLSWRRRAPFVREEGRHGRGRWHPGGRNGPRFRTTCHRRAAGLLDLLTWSKEGPLSLLYGLERRRGVEVAHAPSALDDDPHLIARYLR